MSRMLVVMLMVACAGAPFAGHAQDENTYKGERPRSQQDILREKDRACSKLKGMARTECLDNYVGPVQDKPKGAWKRPPNPPKAYGRE